MAKNELNVEDLVFNEERRESDYLELPLSRQTFFLVAAAVVAAGLLALGRVGILNVSQGGFYSSRAAANMGRELMIPAPRGIIFDRFGNPLVENKSVFSAFLNVAEVLKRPEEARAVAKTLGEILDLDPAEIESRILAADLEKSGYITVAQDVTPAQVIKLKDLNLSYLQIGGDYVRHYPEGPTFSHVTGYVGAAEKGNASDGKSGLEKEYDAILRGIEGKMLIYRDAVGSPIDDKISELPRPGQDVVSTIDAEFQRYFYQRMRQSLAALGRDAGVGLALDPRNGEVLALISLPSFDNNKVAKYLNSPGQPLFNRAVSGMYTPGSTIKPLVGLAALRESVIDPLKEIFSMGYIELPNPYDPERPSRFLDWRPQGWVDIRSALARSSNVYFYEVGGGFQDQKGLGIDRLREYWQKFLLGVKTGIDLPEESAGFLPAPDEKEKRTGQIWRIGDTYNVSIGQGDLLTTPIQLMSFIGSVANGGKIFQPKMTFKEPPKVLFDYSEWKSELQAVHEGMVDAVRRPYGTARLLLSLPFSSAGKTGSSQVANNTKTNAFFVGYAPAENPEVAVLVLIENSREGSLNAVPIARDVLEWYYYNRILHEESHSAES